MYNIILKLWKKIFPLSCKVLFIIIVLPVLSILSRFVEIKIIHIHTDRIGHIAGEPQTILASKLYCAERKNKKIEILIGGVACNSVLFAKWVEKVPILWSRCLSAFWFHTRNLIKKTGFHEEPPAPWSDYKAVNIKDAQISLSAQDLLKGNELRIQMGLKHNDWFVCFEAHDMTYHVKSHSKLSADRLTKGATFRSVPIERYLKAVSQVTKRGGYAIRMGAYVGSKLTTDDSKIIDYANLYRSEFGDIYLCARCRFFLAGATGLSAVPGCFGVPVAAPNLIPVFPLNFVKESLFTPMLVKDLKTDTLLTFREMYNFGMFDVYDQWNYWERFNENGFELIQNGEEDIEELCLDMLEQLDGVDPTPEAREIQLYYRDRFLNHIPHYKCAPLIGPRFASRYRHLIVE